MVEVAFEKIKFTNKTPYYISYKKGPKMPKGFSFEVNGELILNEIDVWYGGKWRHKSNIQVEGNTIVFKQFVPSQQENLTGLVSGLTTSVVEKLFKKLG